jgi:septum formation protein
MDQVVGKILMETIILASASPRRKEILEGLRVPFEVVTTRVDEEKYARFPAAKQVKLLAADKAMACFELLKNENPGWIAAFDTLVEARGRILGKPENREDAGRMLSHLSGKTHSVYTGIALFSEIGKRLDTRFAKTRVHFIKMSGKEIEFYLDTGEWEDVAGAYRVQERASLFIDRIKGSYSNVVGLPISLFYAMLRDANYTFS